MDTVFWSAGVSRVVVRFADGELLEGDVDRFDLDHPEFELSISDGATNNRRALIPLPSVKWVTLHRGPSAQPAAGLQKVAIRFRDGEVLRGLLGRAPSQGRHGIVVELLSRDASTVQVLGIPWHALKAVFYLRDWDGRTTDAETPPAETAETPLVELIGDITRLRSLRERGELSPEDFDRRRRVILDLI